MTIKLQIDDIPNCPICGNRLVPTILTVDGLRFFSFMCDCNNDPETAAKLRDMRQAGKLLLIEIRDNDPSCDLECEHCLFALTCVNNPSKSIYKN